MRAKLFFVLLAGFFILPGCRNVKEKITGIGPGDRYSWSFEIDEKDLIPEGIAYDPVSDHFFLSSIYKQKIVRVSRGGEYSDFIKSGQDSLQECLGLKVDEKRRRLWAVSNSADLRHSYIHIYDLDTKQLLGRLSLSEKNPHLLNDLALTTRGDAYVTDTEGNGIYFVPADLSHMNLYLRSDSLLAEVNGITISPDNSKLYAASTLSGINIVELKSKTITPLENWLSVDTRGIDGLVIYRNSLIGIRNGVRGLPAFHAVRYFLNNGGNEILEAELIDPGCDLVEVPTTGVIAGDKFYLLAVTSLGVHIRKRMNETNLLNNPVVLQYALSR